MDTTIVGAAITGGATATAAYLAARHQRDPGAGPDRPRVPLRPVTWALFVVLVLAAGVVGGLVGRSLEDDRQDEPRAADVAVACDALEELGNAVGDAEDATTAAEVEAAIQPPVDRFAETAAGSGDETLADLGATVKDNFSTYLTATDAIDSREAGNAADIAVDRSAQRCIELGADNDFPTQAEP